MTASALEQCSSRYDAANQRLADDIKAVKQLQSDIAALTAKATTLVSYFSAFGKQGYG